MSDYTIVPTKNTEASTVSEAVGLMAQPENADKRLVVLSHLDRDTVAGIFSEFSESGVRITHKHMVFATRHDGAERTWFCPTRETARNFVKKIKAAKGDGKYVAVKF